MVSLAVLGGRRDPVHRVRHVGGKAVGEVREPEGDVGDADLGVAGDDLGHRPLWGEQDEDHPVGERGDRVVEDPGPRLVVLEDVAQEDPGDAAAVRDEVDHRVAERRGGAVEAPVALRRQHRAQPARPTAPILNQGAPGEPGRADLIARRIPIRPRRLQVLIPGGPFPDIGGLRLVRPLMCGHRTSLLLASASPTTLPCSGCVRSRDHASKSCTEERQWGYIVGRHWRPLKNRAVRDGRPAPRA